MAYYNKNEGRSGEMIDDLAQTDWQQPLLEKLGVTYFEEVTEFLTTVYTAGEVYPARENVFAALQTTPLNKVKVVILGQDPYPNPKQAQGLSFSVPAGMALPKSLINIYKEYETDLQQAAPQTGDLTTWADQGVLLLNSVLTVPAHQANGHAGKIWEALTDACIELVAAQNQPTVFILWGKYAQAKHKLIQGQHNLVLQAPHPSPLSAYRGFFGSRPFSQANAYLIQQGVTPIIW